MTRLAPPARLTDRKPELADGMLAGQKTAGEIPAVQIIV